jgi:hypothetical protein
MNIPLFYKVVNSSSSTSSKCTVNTRYPKRKSSARERLAHAEAAAYFETSIENLHELPEGEDRDAREIGLELARGGALSVARGYSSPEVRACYARVRELNDRLTPGPAQLPGWIGLGQYATMTSTFPQLLEAGEQVLEIAKPLPIPMLHALGHLLIGIGSTTSDTPKNAIGHLEEVVRIASEQAFMPATPNDPDLEVAARSTLLIAYQSAGEIAQSLEQAGARGDEIDLRLHEWQTAPAG